MRAVRVRSRQLSGLNNQYFDCRMSLLSGGGGGGGGGEGGGGGGLCAG